MSDLEAFHRKLFRDNSLTYEGDIYYGVPFGKGVEIYPSGKYTGDFWYTWNLGDGEYLSNDGKVKLTGKWNYGFVWPAENGEFFVGSFSDNGKRNGRGTCRPETDSAFLKVEWCEYKEGARVNR